jgi:hypothetical protein
MAADVVRNSQYWKKAGAMEADHSNWPVFLCEGAS